MKKIVSCILAVLMLCCMTACGEKDYIGVDKAKQAVVDDIGIALDDAEFALNDLIEDASGDYYHIKMSKDGIDYDYKIDAMTGDVVSKDSTNSAAGETDILGDDNSSAGDEDTSGNDNAQGGEDSTDDSADDNSGKATDKDGIIDNSDSNENTSETQM